MSKWNYSEPPKDRWVIRESYSGNEYEMIQNSNNERHTHFDIWKCKTGVEFTERILISNKWKESPQKPEI